MYRKNFVSMWSLSFSIRNDAVGDGWHASFRTPTRLLHNAKRSWANNGVAAENLDEDTKTAMIYVLLMHIRDRVPLQFSRGSKGSPADLLKIDWVDTGIFWHNRICIQIRFVHFLGLCTCSHWKTVDIETQGRASPGCPDNVTDKSQAVTDEHQIMNAGTDISTMLLSETLLPPSNR